MPAGSEDRRAVGRGEKMGRGPGGGERVGDRDADLILPRGKTMVDLPGQTSFAVEQMRQSGDIQQQRFGGVSLFQSDQRAERLAGDGKMLQPRPIVERRVRLPVQSARSVL